MQTVLLVDDDPVQLRAREAILRSAGIAVSLATSVEGALAVLRTEPIRVSAVITDHLLTGATGVDLVRGLRATLPCMSVLVLTGMLDIEDEYEGMDVTIVHKPIQPKELIALVGKALNASPPGSSAA